MHSAQKAKVSVSADYEKIRYLRTSIECCSATHLQAYRVAKPLFSTVYSELGIPFVEDVSLNSRLSYQRKAYLDD